MSRLLLVSALLMFLGCKKEKASPPSFKNTFTATINGRIFISVDTRVLIHSLFTGIRTIYINGKDTSGLSIGLHYGPYNDAQVYSDIAFNGTGAGATVFPMSLPGVTMTSGMFRITNVNKTTYEYRQVIKGEFECKNLQNSTPYNIIEGQFSVIF